MTTREAADHLGVTPARVRALVASNALVARRVGTQWLLDADAVEHQSLLTQAAATSRAMSARIAWAAGALGDERSAPWLSTSERTRLRKRLSTANNAETWQRWLASRASAVVRYRLGASEVDALLNAAGVVRTGVSAVQAYNLSLGTGEAVDAYVSPSTAQRLARDFHLIDTRRGNLTLRIVAADLHLATARHLDGHVVTPRLMVGVDLADDTDTRTRRAGHTLLRHIMDERRRTGWLSAAGQ